MTRLFLAFALVLAVGCGKEVQQAPVVKRGTPTLAPPLVDWKKKDAQRKVMNVEIEEAREEIIAELKQTEALANAENLSDIRRRLNAKITEKTIAAVKNAQVNSIEELNKIAVQAENQAAVIAAREVEAELQAKQNP